jgi:hypothetical protein
MLMVDRPLYYPPRAAAQHHLTSLKRHIQRLIHSRFIYGANVNNDADASLNGTKLISKNQCYFNI